MYRYAVDTVIYRWYEEAVDNGLFCVYFIPFGVVAADTCVTANRLHHCQLVQVDMTIKLEDEEKKTKQKAAMIK